MANSSTKTVFKPSLGQRAHPSAVAKQFTTKVAPGANKSFGVTTEKIPVKHSKRQSISSKKAAPYLNPEYVQQNFADKYGFKKQPTGRSPLSDFEHARYMSHYGQLDSHSLMHPQERAMVHKESAGFKTHSVAKSKSNVGPIGGPPTGNTRNGALRLSGSHKAHQVGKRSGKR